MTAQIKLHYRDEYQQAVVGGLTASNLWRFLRKIKKINEHNQFDADLFVAKYNNTPPIMLDNGKYYFKKVYWDKIFTDPKHLGDLLELKNEAKSNTLVNQVKYGPSASEPSPKSCKLQAEDCKYETIDFNFKIIDFDTIESKVSRGSTVKVGDRWSRLSPLGKPATLSYRNSTIRFDRLFSALFRKEDYPKRISFKDVTLGEYQTQNVKIVDKVHQDLITKINKGVKEIREGTLTEKAEIEKSLIDQYLGLSEGDLKKLKDVSKEKRELILQML